jgi:hypothetical protein
MDIQVANLSAPNWVCNSERKGLLKEKIVSISIFDDGNFSQLLITDEYGRSECLMQSWLPMCSRLIQSYGASIS